MVRGATWTLIGIVTGGGFGFVVDARQGRRDLGTEPKGDGLFDLRRSVEAQTARVDDLVNDVGTVHGAVGSLGRHIDHRNGHRVCTHHRVVFQRLGETDGEISGIHVEQAGEMTPATGSPT